MFHWSKMCDYNNKAQTNAKYARITAIYANLQKRSGNLMKLEVNPGPDEETGIALAHGPSFNVVQGPIWGTPATRLAPGVFTYFRNHV